jgi:phosphonate transport system substrate-binding protein
MNVGFSASTFLDIEKDQAKSISALWASLVARKWGGRTETVICTSLTEFQQGIRDEKLDVVVLLASEYLALRDKLPLEPVFVSARDKEIYYQYILVVRNDRGLRSLTDLKGKKVLLPRNLTASGNDMWLDTLLMRKGIAAPERYFVSDQKIFKPSGAVMPVFFGKADACIVSKRSLQIMTELNPQLQRELMILEESPPTPNCIIAFRKGLPGSRKEVFMKVLESLGQDTEGEQLLTLFRMNRLVPYRHSYLIPMEKLFREYRKLKRRTAKRT